MHNDRVCIAFEHNGRHLYAEWDGPTGTSIVIGEESGDGREAIVQFLVTPMDQHGEYMGQREMMKDMISDELDRRAHQEIYFQMFNPVVQRQAYPEGMILASTFAAVLKTKSFISDKAILGAAIDKLLAAISTKFGRTYFVYIFRPGEKRFIKNLLNYLLLDAENRHSMNNQGTTRLALESAFRRGGFALIRNIAGEHLESDTLFAIYSSDIQGDPKRKTKQASVDEYPRACIEEMQQHHRPSATVVPTSCTLSKHEDKLLSELVATHFVNYHSTDRTRVLVSIRERMSDGSTSLNPLFEFDYIFADCPSIREKMFDRLLSRSLTIGTLAMQMFCPPTDRPAYPLGRMICCESFKFRDGAQSTLRSNPQLFTKSMDLVLQYLHTSYADSKIYTVNTPTYIGYITTDETQAEDSGEQDAFLCELFKAGDFAVHRLVAPYLEETGYFAIFASSALHDKNLRQVQRSVQESSNALTTAQWEFQLSEFITDNEVGMGPNPAFLTLDDLAKNIIQREEFFRTAEEFFDRETDQRD